MSVRRHLHFGETPRFDALYQTVKRNTDNKGRLVFANYDPSLGVPPTEEQVILLQSYSPIMPTITFTAVEKLHGENMAVCYSQGELWVQGRPQIRTILGDQNGMAHFVESTKSTWMQLINILEGMYNINTDTHTIVLDMEWAGGNIQKGNAACSGTEKGAYLFEYFRVVSNTDDSAVLFPTTTAYPDHGIYRLAQFGHYELEIDFNKPKEMEELLMKAALKIEAESPIAKYFDKPDNVGEGLYLHSQPTDTHPGYRLKVKGELHGGKPKSPRESKQSLSTAESKALQELAATVTPVWRITQAMTEMSATEAKHLGQVIKWVMSDIAKEEVQVLLDNNVELKDLSRFISAEVKEYFFASLKSF